MDFTLTKEQQDIVMAAREFALGEFPERAQDFDRNETFDLDIWRKACELGFVGVFIDEAYGGAGLGFFEHCLITEEFWAVDAGMANAIITTGAGFRLIEPPLPLTTQRCAVISAYGSGTRKAARRNRKRPEVPTAFAEAEIHSHALYLSRGEDAGMHLSV